MTKAIMYHYVRPFDTEYPHFKNLHIDDFKQQLDYFEKEYGFVRKADFLDSFITGKLPKGVILTFDDGLSCHYNYVYPELKRRGLWGIFYVPTQPYTAGRFVDVHRAHLLLGKHGGEKVYRVLEPWLDDSMFDQSKKADFEALTYLIQENDDYTLLVKRILNYYLKYNHREVLVERLMEELLPNQAEILKHYYLTAAQMREMADGGMWLGSHTVSHPVLSRLTTEAQQQEIDDSFLYLEQTLGAARLKPQTFCYPYGGFHSFTAATEQLLAARGCVFSFNVEQRDIAASDVLQRPQALPRYDCNQFPYGQVRTISTTEVSSK